MSRYLYRLGALAHHRPLPVVIAWLLLLASVVGLALTSGGRISTSMTIDGTPSQQVIEALREKLPAASGGQGTIVFTAPEGERLDTGARAHAIATTSTEITTLPVVVDRAAPPVPADSVNAGSPSATPTVGASPSHHPLVVNGSPVAGVLVSRDGTVAMLQMQFTTPVDALPEGTVDSISEIATRGTSASGVTALPSQSLQAMHPPIGGHEAIGLGIALLVLVLTLGSLRAAGLPLLTALTGVAIGVGGAFALSTTITLTTATPALALMVGLAVGIDYALFIVNRQRRLILVEGLSAADATAKAVATAGSAVVFAGSTVVIALTGLTVIGIGFLTTMSLVAAPTVALAVLIALTLVPAGLGLLGEGIVSARARATGAVVTANEEQRLANRWVSSLVRRPWVPVITVVVLLGLAAIPAATMRLGMPTGATDSLDSSSRQSYDAITRGFGEGFNAPLVVVAHPRGSATFDQAGVAAITQGLAKTAGVSAVTPTGVSPDRSLAMFAVIPEAGPDDERTASLVEALRDPGAGAAAAADVTLGVTGLTAVNLDISQRLGDVLPEYIAIIVGLSLILLLLVFRSVVIPITATAGFLLSIAATFGLTTAVFQWGWLMGLVGIDTGGPLLSFLPIMVTSILYGLAMDYQVFLVTAMHEAKVQGMSAGAAIVHGFDHSSRVVVAAAVIMVSVFAGFVFSDDPMIKQFGFALAVGVVIDAFLVRMTLVPAVMSLLGERAWWLPSWATRRMSGVDTEGTEAAGLERGPLSRPRVGPGATLR
ncbi:MAG: MMPL family transporter [Humibacillus sp.]|nr:MMPL family transporter [Humibacillus sp.]MDN5776827.1 MMPL family transporter [Humibacillus sp.]